MEPKQKTKHTSNKKTNINSLLGIFRKLFQGRLNRVSYLSVQLTGLAMLFISSYLKNSNPDITGISLLLITIILFIFIISLTIKRLHDIGLSGWYILLLLIPIFNLIMTLLLPIIPGQNKTNKYGTRPKPGINFKNLFGLAKEAGI